VGSGPAGRRLWREVQDRYSLEPHEVELLRRACRAADVLEGIEREAMTSGTFLPTPAQAREWRLTAVILGRMIAGMRLPNEDAGQRPQRRGTPRGAYVVGV
jgi:hypothetical protein